MVREKLVALETLDAANRDIRSLTAWSRLPGKGVKPLRNKISDIVL